MRNPSTKLPKPVPPNFAENFICGGWRKVERLYGARTDLIVKWHRQAGGAALDAARRRFMVTSVCEVPAVNVPAVEE